MKAEIAAVMTSSADLPLIADVQYMEPYASSAFNRKLKGILLPGFYAGFKPIPGNGLAIVVTSPSPGGTASVDVNGHQITVQQRGDITVTLPSGVVSIIALEANYTFGVKTTQVDSSSSVPGSQIIVTTKAELAQNQIELCRVNIPAGANQVDESMIDLSYRVNRLLGIQISSEINSERDDVAASSHAVKKLHDMINSLEISQGSTSQPGIIQLSNEVDSDDDTKAATPRAIKTVNDELINLKESLGNVAGKDIVESVHDTTGDRIPVVGWMGLGGRYRGTTVKEEDFGSLWTDNGEQKSGITIPYDPMHFNYLGVDRDGKGYVGKKDRFDEEISWAKLYSENNKPTPEEIGAVSAKGGDVGPLSISGTWNMLKLRQASEHSSYFMAGFRYNGEEHWRLGQTGTATQDIELKNLLTGVGLRMSHGYTSLVGRLIPTDYSNFDSRYLTRVATRALDVVLDNENQWRRDSETGLIIQKFEGSAVIEGVKHKVLFPKSFPSVCLFVAVEISSEHEDADGSSFEVISKTKANCLLQLKDSGGVGTAIKPIVWAVGV